MSNTLISVIKNVAKPRRALFTTFTFGVSWFESIVIPALRSQQCEQIDILVDARHALKATDEACSLYAGSTYRIIPVYMEKTSVFHPKVAYFQGKNNTDHLAISSANLTASGHGRNLEVISAVSSSQDAGVFGEFGEFLSALMEKYSFTDVDIEILKEYEQRATSLYTSDQLETRPLRKTWLVHTLLNPAHTQFSEYASQLENPSQLTVLSPYHAPSATPVQELANLLEIEKICIGLGGNNENFVVPFDQENSLLNEPEFVTPTEVDDGRWIHAKCFEVQGDNGVMVMTGSVNATTQSLTSTKNVEISLVHWLDESPFSWEPVIPSYYESCDFKVDELTSRHPALQAIFTLTNQLKGKLTPSVQDQLVSLRVMNGDICEQEILNVPLRSGEFNVQLHSDLQATNALQLLLQGDHVTATGWINVEANLTGDEAQKRLARAAARLANGTWNDDDLATLVSHLESITSHDEHVSATLGARRSDNVAQAQSKPVRTMTYVEWRASIGDPRQARTPAGASTLSRSTLEGLINWLNRDVQSGDNSKLGSSAKDGEKDIPSSSTQINVSGAEPPREKLTLLTSNQAEYGQENDEESAEERNHQLILAIVERIPAKLSIDATVPTAALLVEIAGTALLKQAMTLFSANSNSAEKNSSMQALQMWLSRYSSFNYTNDARELLLPFFSAIACCTAHLNSHASLPSLKNSLQKLIRRQLVVGELAICAANALQTNRFLRFSTEQRSAMLTHIDGLEAAITQSEELSHLIAHTLSPAMNTKPAVRDEFKTAFDTLWNLRKSKCPAFAVLQEPPQRLACPICQSKIQSSDMPTFRAKRFLVCSNVTCQRPIFLDLDITLLGQLGLSGRFKD